LPSVSASASREPASTADSTRSFNRRAVTGRLQAVAADIADHEPHRLAGRRGSQEVAADHALGRMQQRP
jgi:hypothetical protein